nr:squamosa promoter-binding-like protein 12 [Tanacetum cinerariifolium]
ATVMATLCFLIIQRSKATTTQASLPAREEPDDGHVQVELTVKDAIALLHLMGLIMLLHILDYHRKHMVCDIHSKSLKVIVAGLEHRFYQQCIRFHGLPELDGKNRRCHK